MRIKLFAWAVLCLAQGSEFILHIKPWILSKEKKKYRWVTLGYEVQGVEPTPQRSNSSHRGDVLGRRQWHCGRKTVLLSNLIHEWVSLSNICWHQNTGNKTVKRIKINEKLFFSYSKQKSQWDQKAAHHKFSFLLGTELDAVHQSPLALRVVGNEVLAGEM